MLLIRSGTPEGVRTMVFPEKGGQAMRSFAGGMCAVVVLALFSTALAAEDVEWRELPRSVQRAKSKYDKQVTAHQRAFEKAVAPARARLAKRIEEAAAALRRELDAAVKRAMDAHDLDLAVALGNAKDSLSGPAQPEGTPAPKRPRDRKLDKKVLIGTWRVVIPSTDERVRWKFASDGTVRNPDHNSSGRWAMMDDHVLITWHTTLGRGPRGALHYWSSFDLPLNPKGTTGDNWSAKNGIRAVKMRR